MSRVGERQYFAARLVPTTAARGRPSQGFVGSGVAASRPAMSKGSARKLVRCNIGGTCFTANVSDVGVSLNRRQRQRPLGVARCEEQCDFLGQLMQLQAEAQSKLLDVH